MELDFAQMFQHQPVRTTILLLTSITGLPRNNQSITLRLSIIVVGLRYPWPRRKRRGFLVQKN